MKREINLDQAKVQLSRLVDEAASGATIIVTKNGKPMARLGPVREVAIRNGPRQLGQLAKDGKGIDWDKWWRDWKVADKEIARDFDAAVARPFPAPRAKGKAPRR